MFRVFIIIVSIFQFGIAGETGQQTTGFADALFTGNEYYNAQTEYMRYLHNNPETENAASVRMRIALCDLYRDDAYGAVRRLSALLTSGAFPEEEPRLRLTLARLYTQLGHHNIAHMHLDAVEKGGNDANLAAARWYRTWTWLCQDRDDKAQEILAQATASPGPRSPDAVADLSASIEHLKQLPHMSPNLAGWMSFFLPGSGQVYAGEPVRGLGSILVNAGFAAWFASRILDKKYGEAAAVYVFGWARFHLGSVRNARQAARNRNREQRARALDALTEKFRFALTPETEKDIY